MIDTWVVRIDGPQQEKIASEEATFIVVVAKIGGEQGSKKNQDGLKNFHVHGRKKPLSCVQEQKDGLNNSPGKQIEENKWEFEEQQAQDEQET